MTGIQEIQDHIYGLEAALLGKRLELAMAQGERTAAQEHLRAMEEAIRAHHAYRMQVGEQGGGCFFNAAGHAGQVLAGSIN